MMKTIAAVLSLLLTLWAPLAIEAFTPSPSHRSVTFKPANKVSGLAPTHTKMTVLRMSEEKPTGGENAEASNKVAEAPTPGTYYDDEVDPTPNKPQISDSMRQRLMSEASTGLDADKKQTNVILYIMLGVAALVILGGEGIFY